ncbi:MAG: 30S ribosomal protein S7 [Spirochaetota bacterium]|jgi:small subunit ribosomal protein S7
MARRRTKSHTRNIRPDGIHGSVLVQKFINSMMLDGKKSTATQLFYQALDRVQEKTGVAGLEQFLKAIENVKPQVEVKSRRVGGVTYQVPVEVYPARKQSLAIRWLVGAARDRSGKTFSDKLANEIMDAINNNGGAIKKKEEVKRMAEANRAFSHYAW